jgi:hypothetical protein
VNRNAVRGTDSSLSHQGIKKILGGKGLQVFQSLRFFSLFQDFLHHFQVQIEISKKKILITEIPVKIPSNPGVVGYP